MHIYYLVTSDSGSVHRFDSAFLAVMYAVLHRLLYNKKPLLKTVAEPDVEGEVP